MNNDYIKTFYVSDAFTLDEVVRIAEYVAYDVHWRYGAFVYPTLIHKPNPRTFAIMVIGIYSEAQKKAVLRFRDAKKTILEERTMSDETRETFLGIIAEARRVVESGEIPPGIFEVLETPLGTVRYIKPNKELADRFSAALTNQKP